MQIERRVTGTNGNPGRVLGWRMLIGHRQKVCTLGKLEKGDHRGKNGVHGDERRVAPSGTQVSHFRPEGIYIVSCAVIFIITNNQHFVVRQLLLPRKTNSHMCVV